MRERLFVQCLYRLGKDRKGTRLNSSHVASSYAVFGLNKKKPQRRDTVFVTNAHPNPGHIACDVNSPAAIVVSLIPAQPLPGALDTEIPPHALFTSDDT